MRIICTLVFSMCFAYQAHSANLAYTIGRIVDCAPSPKGCIWDEVGSTGVIEWISGYQNPITMDFVLASRGFAGPTQFPPQNFAAYGLVAFRAKATSEDVGRHRMICETYISAFSQTSKLSVDADRQMVTIWPIDDDDLAAQLNLSDGSEVCPYAVDNYGLIYSDSSIEMVLGKVSPEKVAELGNGPFLIAWSPTDRIGHPDVPILFVDLSNKVTHTEVLEAFLNWKREIQDDPTIWQLPFDNQNAGLLEKLARFFDDNGNIIEVMK